MRSQTLINIASVGSPFARMWAYVAAHCRASELCPNCIIHVTKVYSVNFDVTMNGCIGQRMMYWSTQIGYLIQEATQRFVNIFTDLKLS